MNPKLLFILIDIVIVLVLAFFAWRGAKKGLILTLFGVLGLLVAFLGAKFVSNTFHEPIADIIEPGIHQNVLDLEKRALNNGELDVNFDFETTVDTLIQSLEKRDLFPGLVDLLKTGLENEAFMLDAKISVAENLSTYLSDLVAKAALFAGSFIVILLLWFLISRALDLAFKLPILSAVNIAGGLVLGLAKAVVIVLVLVWVFQLVGWIPKEPSSPILSLFTPQGFKDFLNHMVM